MTVVVGSPLSVPVTTNLSEKVSATYTIYFLNIKVFIGGLTFIIRV